MAKQSNPPDQPNPLASMSKKALRRLARKLNIKNAQKKSPSALRRAIQRAQAQRIKASQTVTGTSAPIFGLAAPAIHPSHSKPIPNSQFGKQTDVRPSTPEDPLKRQERRRKEALKAYQEHRLRYLFSPSKFVHSGTHEEFLLDDESDLTLPDIYEEQALVAMPIDPFQFYVYWDFDDAALAQVKTYLANEYPFYLRSYDITNLQFDGSNAHTYWDTPCHPLIREWYINTPLNGRNVCCELGVMDDAIGFVAISRSRPIFIPAEHVSEIRQDVFGNFIPEPLLPETKFEGSQKNIQPSKPPISADAMLPVLPLPAPPKLGIHEAFFQSFKRTPILLNPPPEPLRILPNTGFFTPHQAQAQHAQKSHGPALETYFPPAHEETSQWFAEDWGMPPAPAFFPAPNQPQQPKFIPMSVSTNIQTEDAFSTPDALLPHFETQTRQESQPLENQLAAFQAGGHEKIKEWLGVPQSTEIRWFSELPETALPVIFHEWISDPYDQALFVSYSVWPWEWHEHVPLGASDWAQRRYLGASLFSWFKPGASERMVSWMPRKPGASERIKWFRPAGASERPWSGVHTPPGASERQSISQSTQVLWPSHRSGRQLYRKWKLSI